MLLPIWAYPYFYVSMSCTNPSLTFLNLRTMPTVQCTGLPRNITKASPGLRMYNNWKFVYDAVGISCNKVTHQPRVDLQQRIADKGCTADTIERFIGYAPAGKKMNDNQRESYLHCPPVQAVVAAANGDPLRPSSHQPGCNVSITLERDGDLVSLCP